MEGFSQTVFQDINTLRTAPASLNEQFDKMKTVSSRFKGTEALVKDIEFIHQKFVKCETGSCLRWK